VAATYEIEFTASAARSFRKLDETTRRRIALKLDSLGVDPRPRGAVKLSDSDNIFRIRLRDYRILYSIEDRKLIVLVVAIGHRRDVYR
jgi:mRNA interferase RelE/StbE